MSALTIRRGDAYTTSRRLVVTVVDPAGATVDLTGTTIRFMVKRNRDAADAAAVISKSIGAGVTLASPQTGATKGVAYIAIDPADSAPLNASHRYVWELEATDSVGVITLAGGTFAVQADLIRGS